ncbi:MAG TPA: tRNA pseudouridine(13) synthase TruD [Malonomonas sp.]
MSRYLTADLPGTGGSYKEQPDDFQVEELPLYPCAGNGEHLYLWIEKSGISTRELISQLCKGLRIQERELGYAGLKDARARTRQMISVPESCAKRLASLKLQHATILKTDRHSNKLRLGHLAGNRFSIRLHNVTKEALPRAEAILQVLQQRGVPNRFGEQRYGILGNSAQLGMSLLQGRYEDFCRELLGDPEQIRNQEWRAAAAAYRAGELQQALSHLPKRMRDEQQLLRTLLEGKGYRSACFSLPRKLLRLFLSASQSELFDRLLELRLPNLDQLIDGDIAVKHVNGACFRVATAATEQPRVDTFEISASAPLFGPKALLADGLPGQWEQQLLDQNGLSLDSWKLGEGLTMPGERRPLRVQLLGPAVSSDAPDSLLLSFSLPKGSYATSVLHEIIK